MNTGLLEISRKILERKRDEAETEQERVYAENWLAKLDQQILEANEHETNVLNPLGMV
jgi:hypothetical protein